MNIDVKSSLTELNTLTLEGDVQGSITFDGEDIKVKTSMSGGKIVTTTGNQTITGAKTFKGKLTASGGIIGNVEGNASTATKLATTRTIRTNLASTSTASFDGSANVTPGVTGILGTANGGTGRTDGLAQSVVKKFSLTARGSIAYGSNNDYLPDRSAIAYWNGAYNDNNSSNLEYCRNGIIVGASGNQTIAGNKTFSGSTTFNGSTKGTVPSNGDNSTNFCTTSWAIGKNGNRASIAGYETLTKLTGSQTISKTSQDTLFISTSGSVTLTFTVAGSAETCIKVIYLKATGSTTLNVKNATWVDEAPTWGNSGQTLILSAFFIDQKVFLSVFYNSQD